MDTFKDYGIISFILLQCFNSYVTTTMSSCDRCLQSGTCKMVSGTHVVTSLGKGYHPIVTIPAGACRINVTELGNSGNYIALKTSRGVPILNTMWNIQHPGIYKGGGAIFKYSRSGDNCPGECVTTDGPIQSRLVVQLLYLHENRGIEYSYQLPPGVADVTDSVYQGTHPNPATSHTSSHQSTETPHYSEANTRDEFPPVHATLKDTNNSSMRVTSHNNDTSIVQTKLHSFDNVNASETVTSTTFVNGNLNRGVIINNRRRHRPVFTSSFADSSRYNARYNTRDSTRKRHQRPLSDRSRHPQRQQLRDVTYYRQTDADGSPHVVIGERDGSLTGINKPEYAVYSWTVAGFTECSRPCGGGVQKTVVDCIQTDTRVSVDRIYCDALAQPEIEHVSCNSAPCDPEWQIGDWFPCSASCGAGQQPRHVVCRQMISATKSGTVPEHHCSAPKPATSRHCHNGPCYTWELGKWTNCSVDCGLGVRRRRVRCKNSIGVVVHNKYCNQSVPATQESCDMGSCTQHWYYTKWSNKCSSDCGSGSVSRHVHCATDTGQHLSDDRCDATRKPATEKACKNEISACGGKWFVGPWRSCSHSCGQGTRSRDVVCLKEVATGVPAVVNDDQCDVDIKPSTTEPCGAGDCGVQWFMTKWSECSHSCGGGVKLRAVRCFDQHMESSSSCSATSKPATKMDCNMDRCWTLADAAVQRGCRDKYRNCRVVVQARLCRYHFYQRKCCASCSNGLV